MEKGMLMQMIYKSDDERGDGHTNRQEEEEKEEEWDEEEDDDDDDDDDNDNEADDDADVAVDVDVDVDVHDEEADNDIDEEESISHESMHSTLWLPLKAFPSRIVGILGPQYSYGRGNSRHHPNHTDQCSRIPWMA